MVINGGIKNLNALQTKRFDNFYLGAVQPTGHIHQLPICSQILPIASQHLPELSVPWQDYFPTTGPIVHAMAWC